MAVRLLGDVATQLYIIVRVVENCGSGTSHIHIIIVYIGFLTLQMLHCIVHNTQLAALPSYGKR
jgi:hypothetical protein